MKWIKETGLGLGLAVPTMLVLAILPQDWAWQAIAVLLAVIAAIYIGFAINDGRRNILIIEISIATVFLGLVFGGLWLSPIFLIVGYFAHGLWDLAHHPKGVQTTIQSWYPPACLIYDWALGLFMVGYLL